MILHVARTHGYSKVMTGDSCTRLAVKLMTSLALGRGAFLAWDTVRLQLLRAASPPSWPLSLDAASPESGCPRGGG